MSDREKLIELLGGYKKGDYIEARFDSVIESLISNGVTVQKCGRWNIILSDYDDCELMKCSCCGSEFYDGDNDTVDCLHNYCPNCGAKMDGE